jgi:hypothetical protein
MNERLQELAREAGFYSNPDIEKFEKFAELVIQECIDNLFWHGHDEGASQLEWLRVNRFGIKNESNKKVVTNRSSAL